MKRVLQVLILLGLTPWAQTWGSAVPGLLEDEREMARIFNTSALWTSGRGLWLMDQIAPVLEEDKRLFEDYRRYFRARQQSQTLAPPARQNIEPEDRKNCQALCQVKPPRGFVPLEMRDLFFCLEILVIKGQGPGENWTVYRIEDTPAGAPVYEMKRSK